MAVSITSPGLARTPNHAERIIEKPTSNPISSARRKATKSKANTSRFLGPRQFAAEQPNDEPQPNEQKHQQTGNEHTSGRHCGGERSSKQHLVFANLDQPPASRHQDREQKQHQRVE